MQTLQRPLKVCFTLCKGNLLNMAAAICVAGTCWA